MATTKDLQIVKIQPKDIWLSNLLSKLGLIDNKNNYYYDMTNHNYINLDDDDNDNDDENGDKYLVSLDPKEWKKQDHYAVLGLKSKRINATDDEIKKAYRKKVLVHHPDKRSPGKEIDLEHDYFSCITKAYEILGDSIKRRSYDSIDPYFDNTIPSNNQNSKTNFYQIFDPIFKLNARWSNIEPVPSLGSEYSTKEQVNNFYNFWYNFDSWREYSYLDEEEKEKGENREERRWMEKQNKLARAQRKKEEMQRIRQLVDNSYHCDPRVIKFKEEEKSRKQQQKRLKQEAIKAKQLEEERLKKEAEEKERKLKQEEEDKIKAKKEEEKRQKDAFKKKVRKERKLLEVLLENHDYFAQDDKQKFENLKEFDKLCHAISLDNLVRFRQSFEKLTDDNAKKQLFFKELDELNAKIEQEKAASLNSNSNSNGQGSDRQGSRKHWSYDDVQLLIKAIKLFPAGTKDRWAVIAKYINDKSTSNVNRNHRDVLEKAKELQNSSQLQSLKEQANKNAYKSVEQNISTAKVESDPTQRFDAPNTYVELNSEPWTNEEQQLFEQAIKTYPSSLGPERWDLIAECIPNRSRSDCIKRFKYLHELVKSKQAAKEAIHKKQQKKS